MIERYLIAAGLMLCYALAGWYIAHGKPLYVPAIGHCQQLTCNLVQRAMILRRLA